VGPHQHDERRAWCTRMNGSARRTCLQRSAPGCLDGVPVAAVGARGVPRGVHGCPVAAAERARGAYIGHAARLRAPLLRPAQHARLGARRLGQCAVRRASRGGLGPTARRGGAGAGAARQDAIGRISVVWAPRICGRRLACSAPKRT
jgi:hypothetical protein